MDRAHPVQPATRLTLARPGPGAAARRYKCTLTSASQVQARMTAPVKASTPALLAAPPVAIPANAAKNSTPVTSEKMAQLSWCSPRNCQASTRQAVIRPRKPIPPKTICSVPCQLGVTVGPGGVPTGKPSAGSATKKPAPTRPAA